MGREMETNEEKATRYRHRAEEALALIAQTNDEKLRESITLVAANYVSMAERLEDLAKNPRP